MPITEQQAEDLIERGEALKDAISVFHEDMAILEGVPDIEKRTTATEDATNTIKKWVKVTIGALAGLVVVSLALAGLYIKVNTNSKAIKKSQCDFYALILSAGYHPERHLEDLGTTPAESLKAYNDSYHRFVLNNNQLCSYKAEEPDYVTDPDTIKNRT